ncbi:MAG: hypothetical protein ACK5LL_10000 [Suipraeoptans sp.]
MVVDTIQTIKDTEKDADLLIAEADKKCEALLEKAKKESSEIREEAITKGHKQALSAIEKAQKEGDLKLENELSQTENDAKGLKQTVTAKEDEAIEAIIAGLI